MSSYMAKLGMASYNEVGYYFIERVPHSMLRVALKGIHALVNYCCGMNRRFKRLP